MKTKLFNYSGTKAKYLASILPIIEKTNCKIFHEPFLGSGAVFLNIEDKFDIYHLGDTQPGIISAFNAVKNTSYSDYTDFLNFILQKYGNIALTKEAYYGFRDDFANIEFEKNILSIQSGLSALVLFSSCINSLARWNKLKFNQSFGHRSYVIDEKSYNFSKNKLAKTTLVIESFFEKMKLNLFTKDDLFFLDPPYITRCYPFESIKEQIDKLYDFSIITDASIVYTDILRNEHELLQKNNFDMISLRKTMSNSSPYNGKNNSTIIQAEEVCFSKLRF